MRLAARALEPPFFFFAIAVRIRVGMDFPAYNVQSLPESDSHGRSVMLRRHLMEVSRSVLISLDTPIIHCLPIFLFRMRLWNLQRAKGCREYVNISCIRTFKCSRPQQIRRFACTCDGTQNSNKIFHRRSSIPGPHRLDI